MTVSKMFDIPGDYCYSDGVKMCDFSGGENHEEER